MVIDPLEPVVTAVGHLREAMLSLPGRGGITDVALIGSAGDIYAWIPSRIVDFDAFVFVEKLDSTAGYALQVFEREMRERHHALGVDFELRIIQGAYKPQRRPEDHPIVLAHLGVFDETTYLGESVVKRWGWRKYTCQREPGRLARLSNRKPAAEDLLNGPRGVCEKLADLYCGRTSMIEWILPHFAAALRVFDSGNPIFAEFCHGAAATTARHHARLYGCTEADSLGNCDFFRWYDRCILKTHSLLPLMELKARSRNQGFDDVERSRALAIDFLEAVKHTLSPRV